MYLDYISKRITLSNSEEMEFLFDEAFGDASPKIQCIKFIDYYLTSKCGGTDASKFDLSPANSFYDNL